MPYVVGVVLSGEALPALPQSGFQSHRDLLAVPGAWDLAEEDVFPGTSSSVYAFTRKPTRRNLYSVPIPWERGTRRLESVDGNPLEGRRQQSLNVAQQPRISRRHE